MTKDSKKLSIMEFSWPDLDKHESISCSCGNTTWLLKILGINIRSTTHIRVICSKCGSDLPEHGKHHYALCECTIHFSRNSSL